MSSISIVPYTEQRKDQWDAFVSASRNGTVFHTRQFLAYHPTDRFCDASLCFFDGETLVGVLPAALKTDEKGGKILSSHPGASYGGLCVLPDATVSETGEMLSLLKEHANAQGYAGIEILRLAPASLQSTYSEDQHYWLFQQGYLVTRCEMDGAINLVPLTKESVLPSLTGKCRNMVRQAERADIDVRLCNDFAAFWPILLSVLTERHGTKPTHTLEEIERLHELLPDGFRLLGAYREGVMVGGIVLVTIHAAALYTLYMAQEYAAQQFHPMHLLLCEAIQLGIREGRNVLHLGVSTEDGGKKMNDGLFFFKESFGCRPVRRESFSIRL